MKTQEKEITMDNAEKKGLWTRASSWIKNLFKREEQPRKRGKLRKKSTPVLARAKAAVGRASDRLVALARQLGRSAQGLARRAWPHVATLLLRTAEFLEPLAHIVAIMAMVVAGSMLTVSVAVYIAGFVGEAMAAALTCVGVYLGMQYLGTALKTLGDRVDGLATNQLGSGESEPTLEEFGDVLAATAKEVSAALAF
jgi:hypothetical protein